MNVGSLFAGIGGFDLGLERAGMHTSWFCESEPFCQRVLAKHWPGVPCYGDIRDLRGSDIEPVEVLCGGFPCQDISAAGKGAGIAGARSGLWREYARLVGELRPRYVIVENVPLLRTRGLDQVLEDLDACGYDAEWDGISASAVGAPHRRDRIWIVAYPNGDGEHGLAVDAEVARSPGVQQRGAPACDADATAYSGGESARGPRSGVDRPWRRENAAGVGIGVADANGAGLAIGEGVASNARPERSTPVGANWWAVEPDVGRVAHGVPARVDRLRSLGNALVPQIAEWIGRRILAFEGEEHDSGSHNHAGPTSGGAHDGLSWAAGVRIHATA